MSTLRKCEKGARGPARPIEVHGTRPSKMRTGFEDAQLLDAVRILENPEDLFEGAHPFPRCARKSAHLRGDTLGSDRFDRMSFGTGVRAGVGTTAARESGVRPDLAARINRWPTRCPDGPKPMTQTRPNPCFSVLIRRPTVSGARGLCRLLTVGSPLRMLDVDESPQESARRRVSPQAK